MSPLATPLVNSFLRVRSFVTALPTFEIILAGAAFCLALGWGWLHEHDARVRESAQLQSKLAAAQVRDTVWTKQISFQTVAAKAESIRVVHTIHRTDTLWQAVPDTIVTHADTVAALNALPELRRSSEMEGKSCIEAQTTFFRYRTACDSLTGALRDENTILRQQLGTVRPSKYQTVLKWVEIGAAGYMGFRLGRLR